MPATGTIITRSYTSDAQLPIANVGVMFLRPSPTGPRSLLAIRVSDESGRTAPVELATPEASQSEAPIDDASWTAVDLVATHHQYGRIIVENVQVFPGTVTVQALQFVPNETGTPRQTERFDVPPQGLY